MGGALVWTWLNRSSGFKPEPNGPGGKFLFITETTLVVPGVFTHLSSLMMLTFVTGYLS